MRVLITTAPGYGHLFAPTSLAWALRAAGHEVVLATAGRPEAPLSVATWAGLPVVELAAPERIEAVRAQLRATRLRQAAEAGITMARAQELMRRQARDAKHVTGGNPFVFAAEIYGPLSAAMLDGLRSFARRWRPHLLVHEPLMGAGPLVAAELGIPAVEHLAGLCRGPELAAAMADHLTHEYAEAGITPVPAPAATLDVTPPSLGVGRPCGRLMRHVPFNGGAVLPDWPPPPGGRPRIAVTFGSVVPHRMGLAPLKGVTEAAREVEAEFVVAVGPADPGPLHPLPDNVRLLPAYLPLQVLLPSCAAVIHHGGPATTLAALDAGLPQLVLPEMADQFVNAEAVRRRGCGTAIEDGPPDAASIRRLLSDPAPGEAAREVRAEMAAMPTPYDLVPELTALAR